MLNNCLLQALVGDSSHQPTRKQKHNSSLAQCKAQLHTTIQIEQGLKTVLNGLEFAFEMITLFDSKVYGAVSALNSDYWCARPGCMIAGQLRRLWSPGRTLECAVTSTGNKLLGSIDEQNRGQFLYQINMFKNMAA